MFRFFLKKEMVKTWTDQLYIFTLWASILLWWDFWSKADLNFWGDTSMSFSLVNVFEGYQLKESSFNLLFIFISLAIEHTCTFKIIFSQNFPLNLLNVINFRVLLLRCYSFDSSVWKIQSFCWSVWFELYNNMHLFTRFTL